MAGKKKPRKAARKPARKPATPRPAPPLAARPRKSTLAEVRRRVFEVLALRLDGAELADICDHAARQAPPWGLSRSQLYRYIKAADRLSRRHFEKDAGLLLARHVMRRRRLYARAAAAEDYRSALAALDSEAKLEGLFRERLELTGRDGADLFPPLEKIVAALAAAEGKRDGDGADGRAPGTGAAGGGGEALP